ncbi:hypothetical protein BDY24DRAFT_233017 [Mrakia frigida]|uniref:cyclin family protein n=1 Tax=Mrakia frigida TaxID=29902 RepID=UPI003FCC1CEE
MDSSVPLPSSPSSCLRALLSPPLSSSSLQNESSSSTSAAPDLEPSQPSPALSSTLPHFTRLPLFPPVSPESLTLSTLFISKAEAGDAEGDLVSEGEEGDVAFLGGEWKPVVLAGLRLEDRAQMDRLMNLKCSRADAEMAAEVVGIMVPIPKGARYDSRARSQASAHQKEVVGRYLRAWTNLSPHPLVVLISTIIYLERLLANYPSMGKEVVSNDTPLRIAFASFLLALKWSCDVSHLSKSFVPYTPWDLKEVVTMEKQLLGCLKWDVFISSKELLHRATGFWNDAQTLATRSKGIDSGDVSIPGNLFLLQKRPGVEEKSWRGGIVRGSGVGGSRILAGGVDEVEVDPESRDGEGGRQRGRGDDEDEDEELSTVWKGGRLERRGTREHVSRRDGRVRRDTSSQLTC